MVKDRVEKLLQSVCVCVMVKDRVEILRWGSEGGWQVALLGQL